MKNDSDITILIQEFDQLLKKMDSIYCRLAKSSGLSDTAFWILYTVKNKKETYKQKDLCVIWSYSKQTINSALKKLEEKNIIQLEFIPENKKDKKILLTEYGEKIAKEFIEPINEIEKESLSKIKEKSKLINLFKTYIEEMDKETNQFIKKRRPRKYENNY